MFSGWYASYYNWYYYTDDEIGRAKYQVDYFKQRISDIQKKSKMSDKEKEEKISQINLTIDCLRYTYSLYDLD